jgi:hypothetical protein
LSAIGGILASGPVVGVPVDRVSRLLEPGREALGLARAYVSSSRGSRRSASLFSGVETYCSFIGASRSGHSIVGALLDAHPNAVIANGLGDLKYVHVGFGRVRLYHLLLENARDTARVGRPSGPVPYTFAVPGQWQGRFERIRVIGDKQAEGVALRLRARPWLLERLRWTVGVPIRFVHVVRNPFDNISTLAMRAADGYALDLEAAANDYLGLCDTVMRVKERMRDEEMIEVHHERFVEDPVTALEELCHGLALEAPAGYLEQCARVVREEPHTTRHEVEWSARLRREVERRSKAFSFLRDYAFEE